MIQRTTCCLMTRQLVQDLEVSLVAGFTADITVIDLWQRGNEQKWHECESKLEWKAWERKMITEPTKSSSDLFLLGYYAEGNISTSVNMEIFPKFKMHHVKKMLLLDRKVD